MKTWVKIAIPVGVLIVAVIAGGWYLFLRDDSPDAVSLDAALESVTTTTASADGASTTVATTESGIDGTWTVDTSSGDFDFETATGSFVGFRVQEELSGIGSVTAVGRTGDVDGSITIDGSTVTEATFTAELATLTTDRSQRDSKMKAALQVDQFPEASFTLTQPIDLGAGAAAGEAVKVDAVGELTVNGVTKPVTVTIDAKLENGTIVAVGSTTFTFADFDIEKPTAPIVASLADEIVLEMQLLLTRS